MSFLHSIKFRFTLWYLGILTLLLGALSTGVYFYFSHSLHQDLDDSLKIRATQIQQTPALFTQFRQGRFEEELGEVVATYFFYENELIQISARDIEVPHDESIIEKALKGEVAFATANTSDGRELRLCAVPYGQGQLAIYNAPPRYLHMRIGEINTLPILKPVAVVVGRSTENVEHALSGLVQTLSIAVPSAIALAGIGGLFLARQALKPVDQIAKTALEIEEGDLSRRINVNTKDELGRLASTLNQMIERLENAFKRQRQFTGDASHELRTPLSIIQAESTLALQKERPAEEYRNSLELITQEANHMSGIIDQLLTLARADAGTDQMSLEPVNVVELLEDILSNSRRLAEERSLAINAGPMESVSVSGDRARLKELFLNLIENALRYTPPGGTVSISTKQQNQGVIISVADTGIGIPPEHLPYIFDRFYRVDKARSRAEGGSGLGLAIARHIAEAHGGWIEVESEEGKGSIFSVFLPIQSI